jgi:hypothetical protein
MMLGRAPKRIDILTQIDGVAFQGAWARRHAGLDERQRVPIIGREDLPPKLARTAWDHGALRRFGSSSPTKAAAEEEKTTRLWRLRRPRECA